MSWKDLNYMIIFLVEQELLGVIYTVDIYEVCSPVPQCKGQELRTRPIEDHVSTEIFLQFSVKEKGDQSGE